MRIYAWLQRVVERLPRKERTSPLDLGLIHLHRFDEYGRPWWALSILGVACNTFNEGAQAIKVHRQRRCQERGPYKPPRIMQLLTQ